MSNFEFWQSCRKWAVFWKSLSIPKPASSYVKGKIKTERGKKKNIRKFYYIFSKFQCTRDQPISSAYLRQSVNHVQPSISLCLKNLCSQISLWDWGYRPATPPPPLGCAQRKTNINVRTRKTNLMHDLFLVYFVNFYMFRAYLGTSSGGTTVCIQQLVLIILFRWLPVVLVGLESNQNKI